MHKKGFDWVLSTSGVRLGEKPHYGQRIQLAFFFSLSLLSLEVIEFLKRYKKGQCVTLTQGYDGHGTGLILRIQLIIDIVLVEMIF